jgi:hypothetical protein
VVNECNTGSECANFGYKYYIGEGVKQDDFKAVEFLFNTFAFVIRKPKIRTTSTIIQTTRLLEKLYCLEIILFNTFALNKMISKQ